MARHISAVFVLALVFLGFSLFHTAEAGAQGLRIPVLMYHEIEDGTNSNYLEETRFAEQVRWLAENGYEAVTLSQAYDYMRGMKKPTPGKKVVALTFDDGYASFYTKAVPLLRRYGFVATVCVITDQIGKKNHVTWKQLEELVALGFEVASHTKSHPDLTRLGRKALVAEVAESKRILEKRLKVPVRFFCYPAGRYNTIVIKAARDAGYIGALTTRSGLVFPGSDSYQWPRLRIYRGMSLEALAAALRK